MYNKELCQYCDPSNDYCVIFVDRDGNAFMKVETGEINDGPETVSVLIRYCPYCGRILVEEEEVL